MFCNLQGPQSKKLQPESLIKKILLQQLLSDAAIFPEK